MKTRPYRIYRRTGQQKRYVRKDGKKTYIKIKNMKKMPDKNLVTVMIKNVVGHRRVPARSKKEGVSKPLAYTQGIAPRLVHVPLTPFLTDDKKEIEKLKENAKDKTVVVNVEKQGKKEHEPKVTHERSSDQKHDIPNDRGSNFTKTELDKKVNKDLRERVLQSRGGVSDLDGMLERKGEDNLRQLHDDENHRVVREEKGDNGKMYGVNTFGQRVLTAKHGNFRDREVDEPIGVGLDDPSGGSGDSSPTGGGLNTDDIENFLDNRTHTIIPCIAHDEMDTLLPHIHKGMKEFGFVFNTQNHTQAGQHWRACYINTETGDCDYFDSLVSDPDKTFMEGITKIIHKLDPPIYLKLKINRVKLQSNTSANCGQFCCQFLDKMYHGGSFKQATFYDTTNGEKSVNKYKSKWGLI